jgi:glycosyltransferase involved in cell wall biosynthesis
MNSVASNNSRLTVVIPVYNRAGVVRLTLDSLAKQTLRPLKVVLVDNNSSDDSLKILQEWKVQVKAPDFQVEVVEEPTPGAAAARNRGLKEVTTPLTMFFDSDDLMAPNHCQRVVDAFASHLHADIVGWDCKYTSSFEKRTRIYFSSRDVVWKDIFHGTMSTLRYVAKTELFRSVGAWNPECRGWDDIELGLRLLITRPKIVKLHGPMTVAVIGSEDSITGVSYAAKASVWEHALNLMEQTVEGHKRYCRWINLRRAILAGDYRCERAFEEAERLMAVAQAKERCPFYRILNRLAYRYRGAGRHGAARLFRPLF